MADERHADSPKIGLFILWLILIISAGSIALVITSLRVGQQNNTTFGNVYKNFTGSWGGEISIIPSDFYFEEPYTEKENNVETVKYRKHYLLPDSITVNSAINMEKKREGLIAFNSFIVDMDNEYILTNNTSFQENLFVKLKRPENASILYDYIVIIDGKTLDSEVKVDDPFILLPKFNQNQKIRINVLFKTKGIDVIKYKLAVYNKFIIQSFKAVYRINTPEYNLLHFGLPHTIAKIGTGEELTVEMNNFNTNQGMSGLHLYH